MIQAATETIAKPIPKHDQDQRRIRKLVSEYINAAERSGYTQRSPLRSIFTFSHIWLALAVSFGVIV